MQDAYTFLVNHCNRKAHQIEFVRCENDNCSHCVSLTVRDNQFLEVIREFGGHFPTPVWSDVHHHEHYKTLEEMLRVRGENLENDFNPLNFKKCERGCNYLFFSKADGTRHNRLMKH